jgi:hypothetical protein
MASWSKVVHIPPAWVILALAVSVNLNAQTLKFGIFNNLASSVIVPITAKTGSKFLLYIIIKLYLDSKSW